MSSRSINREFRADTYTHHHEAELIIQAVCQRASKVILQHCIEDCEDAIVAPIQISISVPGKSACERVDSKFCGEDREHHGACDGGF